MIENTVQTGAPEALDDIQEAREILENMVRSVEAHGPYSAEATCTFLKQAIQCLPRAALAHSDAVQAPEAVAWECASPEGEKPMLAFLTSKEPTREHYEDQGWRVTPLYLAAPVARAASPSEWQPIETAPKTGRTLLLGYLNSAGKWRTVRGQWMSANYIEAHWEDPDDVDPGWFETSAEADDVPNCWGIEPTHWMPLPAAPQGAAH